jgi:hypothetical protein
MGFLAFLVLTGGSGREGGGVLPLKAPSEKDVV